MTKELLQTILVDELKVGMYVHAISKQNGSLAVKSRGHVSTIAVIPKLKEKGVVSVVIDPSKEKKADAPSPSPQKKPPKKQSGQEDFDMELGRVERLMVQSSKTFKRLALEIKNNELGEVNAAEEMASEIQDSLDRNPNALLCVTAIKNDNTYLSQHALRVSVLLCHFAQSLGIKDEECKELALLGYLFDIGMTLLPSDVLNKAEELDKDDWKLINEHPMKGIELLQGLGLSQRVLLAIEQHHERIDGSGYPSGLKGDMINKYARLLSIVDAFESMTSDRPYRPAIPSVRALKTLLDPKNGFDTKLVNAFAKCVGAYPVGSLVLLSNNRIGMVVKKNEKNLSLPRVNVFYSATGSHYLEPKEISLDGNTNDLKIVKPVLAAQYRIDLKQIFPNF